MKKYEILYDWPVAQVQHLADSNEAETYAIGLADAPLAAFTTLTETIRGLGADLAAAKAARVHFANWDLLRQCLEAFEDQFGNFPGANLPKFRLVVLLADKLAQSAPLLDAADIDENAFEIRELAQPLPLCWFTRENAQSPLDSVAVLNCADLTALKTEIAASNVSPGFAFQLIAALQALAAFPVAHAVLVKRTVPPIEIAAVEAFAKLLLLASGKPVHPPHAYTHPPSIVDVDSIRAGKPYHQLNEVFYVMSEYNSRSELLAKYLSIYHVIENFMFKLPIVELERRRNGQMFSIRDFRKLYRELDISEMNAIKKLMGAVFEFEPIPGTKFHKIICDRWNAFCPAADVPQLNALLERLGVERGDNALKHADFVGDNAAKYFGQIVYKVRCVIVHNTETEWHLSYATLDSITQLLLEKFLFPSLEEICFAFVGQSNNHVWYQNKSLTLYQ